MTYLILKLTTKRLTIVIREPEWCLLINGTENEKNSHKHNIVNFIPLSRWASIKCLPIAHQKFPIASGEWTTDKRTP